MRWVIIFLFFIQSLSSQNFKNGISVVLFNASFLSENSISLEPIRDAETHLLLMGKHPDVFEREKIVYLPTIILYHPGTTHRSSPTNRFSLIAIRCFSISQFIFGGEKFGENF